MAKKKAPSGSGSKGASKAGRSTEVTDANSGGGGGSGATGGSSPMVWGLVLACLVGAPFLHAVTMKGSPHEYFELDDMTNFGKNTHLQQGLTKESIEWAIFDGTLIGVYEPIGWLVKLAVVTVFGGSATTFAYFFAALHILVTVMGFMFWCRLSALYHSLSADADSLSGPPSIALPFVSSLAFGLHPMRAETVRWLSAGGYGIAGLLMLLSLACFTEFVVARKARHMQVLSWLTYAMAIGAKSAAVTASLAHLILSLLVGVLLAKSRASGGGKAGKEGKSPAKLLSGLVSTCIFDAVPFSLISVVGVLFALSASAQGPGFDVYNVERNLSDHHDLYDVERNGLPASAKCNIDAVPRVIRAGYFVFIATFKSVVPHGLRNRYAVPLDFDATSPEYIIFIVAIAAISVALVLRVLESTKRLGLGLAGSWDGLLQRLFPLLMWGLYLGILLPTLGLHGGHTCWMTDRYTYFPHLLVGPPVGMVLMSTLASKLRVGVASLGPTSLPFGTVVVALCAVLGLLTSQACAVWSSEEVMWANTVANDPYDEVAILNYAHIVGRDSGRLAEAVALNKKALKLVPKFAVAWESIGYLHDRMGNYAEAARSFDAASTYDKENPKYALNLARTLEKLGQLDDARAVYERAEELAPEDPRLLEDHAEFYMQAGDHDEALEVYERLVAAEPKHAGAWVQMGNIAKLKKKPDVAMMRFKKAVAADPKYALGHSQLGLLQMEMGQLKEAVATLEKATKLDPSHANTWFKYALALEKSGQTANAMAMYEKVLSIEPVNLNAHQNLGVLKQHDNQFEAAVAHYDEVIKVQEENAGVLFNKAVALMSMGKNAEADDVFLLSGTIDPRYAKPKM